MVNDPSPISESFRALSTFFLGDSTLQATLDLVADLAVDALPADSVGITLLVEGRPTTAAFSGDTAPQIDSVQYEDGSGPCLDAYRHRQVYRIDDLATDQHWPTFSAAAITFGVHSVLAIPLIARHEGLGALNLYAPTSNAFSEHDVEVGVDFATHAAILLANSQAYWDAQTLSHDMAAAMESRATIEQAKGILMAAEHCSADAAFEVLVRASQRENRKLREIADEIVRKTASRPEKVAPPSETSGRLASR